MTLKAVTLLCLMIKDRLTSVTISQEQLPRAVVPAGWAEEIQGRGRHQEQHPTLARCSKIKGPTRRHGFSVNASFHQIKQKANHSRVNQSMNKKHNRTVNLCNRLNTGQQMTCLTTTQHTGKTQSVQYPLAMCIFGKLSKRRSHNCTLKINL